MRSLDFDLALVNCVMVSAITSDSDEIYRNNIPDTEYCLISGGDEPGIISLYDNENDEIAVSYDTTESSIIDICTDIKDRLNRMKFE